MMSNGTRLIHSLLDTLPDVSGVYKMLDVNQRILYIGKAKNLKKRITSYIRPDQHQKVLYLLNVVYHLDYIVTESETDALLLEAQLIKKFQPKFNILLKDDKSFPYIKLRLDHAFPQLVKYRGKKLDGGKFFGPFTSSMQVDKTINELQKIFKLRSCSDSYFANRTRPCLQYQIKRCCAPCVKKIDKQNYNHLVYEVTSFLDGKVQDLQKILSQKMESLSAALRFEAAAEVRDRIKALSYVQLKTHAADTGIIDADVIAIAKIGDHYVIEFFLYRSKQFCGNKAYFPNDNVIASDAADLLESFIIQFYNNHTPPKEIIINQALQNINSIKLAIKNMYNVDTMITNPTSGKKLKLITNVYENALCALNKHLNHITKNQKNLQEIQKIFNLDSAPNRIEVYDNSHIMGSYAVGAMIVSTNNGFDRSQYRTFNINQSSLGDDYAMLREVLNRRFQRTEKYDTPDLIIIDGGKGHMSTACEVFLELNITIPFVCMSKGVDRDSGHEQFHMPYKKVFTIDKNESVMKYLQILRDEAHKFALTTHRKKRAKNIQSSILDAIPGIGDVRKKALLNYFGSHKAVFEASIADLIQVNGISKAVAKIIKNSSKI